MKRKTARALGLTTARSGKMRPIDVASRLRAQRDRLALLLADTEEALTLVEIQAGDEQRNA